MAKDITFSSALPDDIDDRVEKIQSRLEELAPEFEAMEEELFGTAMAETFERTVPSKSDPAGAVDMEKNLLKNLMEAEAIHPGASSPAAALLALIGAKLPGADEDARDMHSDEDEDI